MDKSKRDLILKAKDLLTRKPPTPSAAPPPDPPKPSPPAGPQRATAATRANIMATCSIAKKPFVMIWKPAPTGKNWLLCDSRGLLPSDTAAGGEKGSRIVLKGVLTVASEYPGCPYCKNNSILRCSCGTLTCQGETAKQKSSDLYCPSCDVWSRPSGDHIRDVVADAGGSQPRPERAQLPAGEKSRPALPPRR